MTFRTPRLDDSQLARLAAERNRIGAGQSPDATGVARLDAAWRAAIHPPSKQEEPFDLTDAAGNPTGVTAPRWLCHLLGLCHRTVHLALLAPQGLLVLQVRSPRVDWPGRLDLAVTGHVRAGLAWDEGVAREAAEEIGLEVDPGAAFLAPPGLQPVAQYCRRATDSTNPPVHICHAVKLYAGTLTPTGLARLRFADGEVSGLVLCSPTETARMVAEEPERLAPGLVQSFPHYLDWRASVGDR